MNKFSPLVQVLANRTSPVEVFFRDDDTGWADKRLSDLCELFVAQELPLDLAAIPMALNTRQARDISAMLSNGAPYLHLHQHGFEHVNHQIQGRPCEFGSDRSQMEQRKDIASGQDRLQVLFGEQVQSVFTPPWNRCTTETTAILNSLGFSACSRISGSDPLNSELPELNVSIDWLKKRNGLRISTDKLNLIISRIFKSAIEPVGVMLHHEHMDQENRELLLELMQVLKGSTNVIFKSMAELVELRLIL